MNKINFVMSAKELNTAVERAIYDAKNQRKVLHHVLVAGALHAQMHGDVRPLSRFISGMKQAGRHVRVNAMHKWLEKYTPMHWDNKKQMFRFVQREWDIDAGIKSPFYDDKAGKGQQEGVNFDPEKDQKQVVAFLKRHKTLAEQNGATETAAKYDAMLQAAMAG